MKRLFSVLLFAFTVFAATEIFADAIEASLPIRGAVVYPSSARITRGARIHLEEGAQTVRIIDVQPVFDENSLSVAGAGTAMVKILGAGVKTEYLKESSDDRVRELQAKIQGVDDAIAQLQGALATLAEKKAFLTSVRLFANGQLPKDLVTKVPTAEELKATLTFIETENKAYADEFQSQNIKMRETAREREVLQKELNQLMSGAAQEKRVLTVDLECEKSGDLDLEVSYTLPRVSWYPLYDARADFGKGKAVLGAFAVVRQSTGEDWTNVNLTLSTARPAVGGRMPELSSWYLRPVAPVSYRNKAKGMMLAAQSVEFDAASDKMMMENEAVATGGMAAPAAAPVARRAEMVYAVNDASGATLTYQAARPVTVKSDGSDTRVPLMVQTLDAAFEYAATPKLSPYAYLKSTVVNDPNAQLLAGRVNIFLDGTFVGNSDIPKTIAPGETFDLYLGVDEGVVVKRELIEKKSDDTLIGMIPSPSRKIAYKYKITVENYKPRAIKLGLFDQAPVAQDDKIRVTDVQASVKPDTDKYRDRAGVYLWTLEIQPKEKKEILFSYVIEFPRDLSVDGL